MPRSHAMNAASSTAPTAKPATLRALPQPYSGASMIVKINSAIAAVDSAKPPRSVFGACGSRDVGTLYATIAAPSAATGAIAKKMLDHEKPSSSQPPTIGPSATATPAVAPHNPIACARSARPVKMFEISDSVAGNTIAAPKPMKQRATISCPGVAVSPPAMLATPSTARPASSIPLRPTRSLRLPDTSSSAANTRLYASTIHCSWLFDACSSRTSVGSATFTIVVSRLITNAATSSAASAVPLRLINI